MRGKRKGWCMELDENRKATDIRLDLECWIDWRHNKVRINCPTQGGRIAFRNVRIHPYDDRVVGCPRLKPDEVIDLFECPEGRVANTKELEKLLKEHFASLQSLYGALAGCRLDIDEVDTTLENGTRGTAW